MCDHCVRQGLCQGSTDGQAGTGGARCSPVSWQRWAGLLTCW